MRIYKILNFLRDNWYIPVLLCISFISHWYIFFDFKILNAGDWIFLFNSQSDIAKTAVLYTPQTDFGVVRAFPNNWIFYFLFYIINLFGASWDLFTRLFFLIPIIFLTPVFSFLLFKKLLNNSRAAFFGACIYSFNTIFLKLQLGWITYAFIWWILPCLFLNIINFLETKKWKFLIYNSLLIFLGIVYELRIMLLVLIFLSFFLFINLIFHWDEFKREFKNGIYFLVSVLLGIFGHAFWLLPIKINKIDTDILSRAAPTPFASYFDILDSFSLHTYTWFHNFALAPFIKQPIEYRYFLIPIFVLIGILFFEKKNKTKNQNIYFIFFLSILVIFLFLSKQGFEPFKTFYDWAFINIPLFNLFRESSKFYILVAIAISLFYAIGLDKLYCCLERYKYINVALVTVLLFFSSIFNLQHFVDQKVGTMAKGIEIPNDYNVLERQLASDEEYYRILWLPAKGRFGFYTDVHPALSMANLVPMWEDKLGFWISHKNQPLWEQFLFLLKYPNASHFLDTASVKYVVIPILEEVEIKKDIGDSKKAYDLFMHYGPRNVYIEELEQLDYLKKVDIGQKDLLVYENLNFKPHIYLSNDLTYMDSSFNNFGLLEKNKTTNIIFLGSQVLDKNSYLLDKINNFIIPVESSFSAVQEMKKTFYKEVNLFEKKKLKSNLDFYFLGGFLKDFILKIPVTQKYSIYIKKMSILENNKNNLQIKIGKTLISRRTLAAQKHNFDTNYIWFNDVEVPKGKYGFELYVNKEKVDFVDPQNVILVSENNIDNNTLPLLEYREINPTKYVINVRGASENFSLIFSEKFHDKWKISVEKNLRTTFGSEFISKNNQGTIQNNNLNPGKFYDIFSRTTSLDTHHFQVNNFANAWWVDLEELEKEGKISKNNDGTYDFSVTLEFEPQKYFYIGLAISLFTMLSCVSYLLYKFFTWLYNRRRKSSLYIKE